VQHFLWRTSCFGHHGGRVALKTYAAHQSPRQSSEILLPSTRLLPLYVTGLGSVPSALLLACLGFPDETKFFLRSRQSLMWLRNSPSFIELEDFVSCSQNLAILSCLEPDESSPQLLILLCKVNYNITFHLPLRLPSGLFPSGFPTTTWNSFLICVIRVACLTHLILPDVIVITILCEECTLWSCSARYCLYSLVTYSLLAPNILRCRFFWSTLICFLPSGPGTDFTPVYR
jgi:hypothetical protein